MEAIAQQSKAGWKRLLAGFVSKQWENVQTAFLETSHEQITYKSNMWTELFLSALWQFNQALWLYRNGMKHVAISPEVGSNLTILHGEKWDAI